MRRFSVEMTAHVEVTIEDYDEIVGRVLDNVNGWREHFYTLNDRDEVLEMFAYNAVANGETDVRRLDGWADLKPQLGTMNVVEAFANTVTEIGGRE